MDRNSSHLPNPQPNGPVPLGTDNPAFSPDPGMKRADHVIKDQRPARPMEWDFRGTASDEWDSQCHSTDDVRRTPHGSVGKASRLDDFDGEIDLDDEKLWDVFEETPWENLAHADRQFWSYVNKLSRLALILILFAMVLGASLLSFLSLLLIVYNMNAASHDFTLSVSGQLQVLQRAGDKVHVRWVWAAMMVTSAPYFFSLCSCLQKLCVKRTRRLRWRPLLIALTVETVHSVGLGAFVFIVAPSYDPIMVLMLSYGVTFVPSLLQTYRVRRSQGVEETGVSWVFLLTALASLAFPALLVYKLYDHNIPLSLITYFSPLLLSVEWWENFVAVTDKWKQQRRKEARKAERNYDCTRTHKEPAFKAGSWLFRVKYSIRDRRTKIEAVCSAWKLLLTLVTPMVVFASRGGTDCMSALFYTQDTAAGCSLWRLGLDSSGSDWCLLYLPFVVAAVAILTSGTAFKAAKVACKIHAQKLCFALPLLLSGPATLVVLVLTYRGPLELGGCLGDPVRWPRLVGDVEVGQMLKEYVVEYWLFLMVAGMVLLEVTTFHVWWSSAERVASTEKLFVRPLYCGVMFAQSVLLNRAVDNDDTLGISLTAAARKNEHWTHRYEKKTEQLPEDKISEEMKHADFPRIYACATMWHETETEMAQLLKSLFRMDRDQSVRSYMWKTMNVVDQDFYLYEGHIFFDDAFTKEKTLSGEEYFVLNSHVRQFLDVVYVAARSIYPPNVELLPPTKMETPYGGRLTYILPGTNLLTVHLKNKHLIRHKKRWSQVMYMYYLLSYKLLLGDNSDKRRLADNTFILALDGDVDFYPDAVRLLVDRMRRNKRVGAACGRIHPIGSGLMVWYQKFEYAVSHWLQKATEHVFGCVLCSPGCFSLFRASALMDDNVLRRYTKQATQARHAVQYDMGEDRWLCTLLLQQGWRVEYAAAADALTFCPDDFKEFFKQRRRWTPSTMANILDLLSNGRHVTKVNGSVSLPFIAYQTFLFISSVLTPGTIFLLILGAINTAYPTLPLYGALLLNCLPILVYLVLCFTASDDVQITYAGILSTLYSLVMMVVLVGLLRQVAESGMCSVTAIFFVGVAGIFVLAALLHPQEVGNLAYGLLYFLAIPCTSMLLIFYAVSNLNVVTWGTRDAKKPSSGGGPAQPQSRLQRLQGGLKRVVSVGAGGGSGDSDADAEKTSDYTFSFGNLFRCICCPTKRENSDFMERFEGLENALHDLRRTLRADKGHNEDSVDLEEWGSLSPPHSFSPRAYPLPRGDDYQQSTPLLNANFSLETGDRKTSNPLFRLHEDKADEKGTGPGEQRDSTLWIEDPKLDSGATEYLHAQEKKFWEELIETYLTPLDRDPQNESKQKAMAEELTALRNKTAMMFFLSNALFVTVIFILESVSEYTPGLTLQLPCDRGHVGQKIEPISVTFTVVFGILLLLQLLGMLLHRFSTFVHIVAATKLHCRRRSVGSDAENYAKYGTQDWYSFSMDMIRQSRPRRPEEELSEVTSLVGGQSISKDTITGSEGADRNIVSKIFQRQKSRKQTVRLQNLHEAMDEGLMPVLDSIAVAAGREGEEEEGEGQIEGTAVDTVQFGPDVDMDDRGRDPIPRGLNWMGERSHKVFRALAKDREKMQLIRQRTQINRDRWKTGFTAVRSRAQHNSMAGVASQMMMMRKNQQSEVAQEGTDEARRNHTGDSTQPKRMFDVVNRVLQQKTVQEPNGEGNEDPGDPPPDDAKTPHVTFKNEVDVRAGPGVPKRVGLGGKRSPASPHAPRIGLSPMWKKAREADRLLMEQAGVTSADNVPLRAVAEVHDSQASRTSGQRPEKTDLSPRASEDEIPEEAAESVTQM